MKTGRNDPCPCGSGKKYKQCHGAVGAQPLRAATKATGMTNGAATTINTTAGIQAVEIAQLVRLALQHHQSGNLREAEALYRRILTLQPANSDAIHFLGYISYQLGNLNSALDLMRQSIALMPGAAQYHGNLGVVLMQADRLEEAEQALQRSLELKPDGFESLNNLGTLYQNRGRFDRALAYFEQAIAVKPDYLDAIGNKGGALASMDHLDEAAACYSQALKIDANNPEAHYYFCFVLFRQGRLREAWEEYEWRFHPALKPQFRVQVRPFRGARWDGGNIEGRSLLVHSEQGVGDDLWLSGMFADVREAIGPDARLLIECAPKLLPLFRRSFPGMSFAGKTNPPDPACMAGIDMQIPAASLGRLLRPEPARFPRREHYLDAHQGRSRTWREKFSSAGGGLRVGVCWSSSNRKGQRALSCTNLAQWEPVLKLQGIRFINLQYDDCEAELAAAEKLFDVHVERYPEVDMYDDLDETAALMCSLDLVISAPTAVSVLSAALGVKTWQLNYGEDWQSCGLDHNPWYPAMRSVVRRWDENWESVLARVARDLEKLRAEQR